MLKISLIYFVLHIELNPVSTVIKSEGNKQANRSRQHQLDCIYLNFENLYFRFYFY